MSSKSKILAVALVFLFTVGLWATTSKADVTGSFGIHISFEPIQCQFLTNFGIDGFPDQPCEKTFFKIDFETNININITISGLMMGIHAHTGVTGFEDIQLTFATTLGALDISDTFVFAQPFAIYVIDDNGSEQTDEPGIEQGDVLDPQDEQIPTCLEDETASGVCLTLFVKKRVEMTISLGGVTLSNLAMLEDVNFPNYCGTLANQYDNGCVQPIKGVDTPLTYNLGDQKFGFGDVISLSGQTPSGITVTAETGICAEQLINAIKKHSWGTVVDSHCVAGMEIGAEKYEADQVQSGSAELDELLPFPAFVGPSVHAGITISDVNSNCVTTIGVGTDCDKSFVLANNSITPVLVFLSVHVNSQNSPPGNFVAAISFTCNPGGSFSDNMLTQKLFPGESTYCEWASGVLAPGALQSLQDGDIVYTDIIVKEESPKSPLLFSYEHLAIEGIALTSGLTLDIGVDCGSLGGSAEVGVVFPCNVSDTITISGGPIFDTITVASGFDNILGPATFTDITVTASGGPMLLVISFSPATFTPTKFSATASFTLNPDTNPASLRLRASGAPNLTRFEALLTVRRAGLTFTANTRWNVSAAAHTFVFRDLTLGLSADAGIVNIAGNILVKGQTGGTGLRGAFMVGGDITFTVNF